MSTRPTVYSVQIFHTRTGEVRFLTHTDLDTLKETYELWAKEGWSWWEWGKMSYGLLSGTELAQVFGKQPSQDPVVE